nr:MAG TPA: hypothetical protein [Caudoviricetes sp.]
MKGKLCKISQNIICFLANFKNPINVFFASFPQTFQQV